MSLLKYTRDLTEIVTLTTHPYQRFISSSNGSITGSVPLLGASSDVIKTMESLSGAFEAFDESAFSINDTPMDEASGLVIKNIAKYNAGEEPLGVNVSGLVDDYMTVVNSLDQDPKNLVSLDIERLSPTPYYSTITNLKGYITRILMDHYRTDYNNCDMSYVNYNTLNFFTSSTVPENSVFLYPNFTSSYSSNTAPYTPLGPFTIDFYINPRYTNDVDIDTQAPFGPKGKEFKAGTILHLSSCFAVSLVSGSARDSCHKVNGYRILLQLTNSADISPSKIDLSKVNNKREGEEKYVFVSEDNSLDRNKWHHVSIRWGGRTFNHGTGSIEIDGKSTSFEADFDSICPPDTADMVSNEADALCVGNYYEGRNQGADAMSAFFNKNSAYSYGTIADVNHTSDPSAYSFAHPLNAEIHDVKIYHTYLDDRKVSSASYFGSSNLPDSDRMVFYVPPFFIRETPDRNVMVSTNTFAHTSTNTPVNAYVAFGPFGHLVNLENFVHDFSKKTWPRLLNLEADINPDATAPTFDEILYATGSIVKRNLTILPCDNGRFIPNFKLLQSGTEGHLAGSSPMRFFSNDLGGLDLAVISLRDLCPEPANLQTLAPPNFIEKCSGPYPFQPNGPSPNERQNKQTANNFTKEWNGSYLAVKQRLKDCSSNQITIFNIPGIFYSQKIRPESFCVKDIALSGSGGKIKINLEDDGRGSLYRADSDSKHAWWNGVGNIFYREGLAIVKSPHLNFFGKDYFDMNFEGTHDVHVTTLNCFADADLINSSTNKSYKPISASLDVNSGDAKFVYIDEINLHDNNLNVIMRGRLAQPVLKKTADELLFKLKMDF